MRRAWYAAVASSLVAQVASAGVTRALLVVVPTDEKGERQAMELERSLAVLLSTDPRIELVEPASRYVPQEAERTARQVDTARAALEAVRSAVRRLEYEEARARAEAALIETRSGDFRALREVELDLLVELAAIEHALEVDDRGAADLAQALVIEPQLQVPRGWNSKERAWFSKMKRTVAASKPRPVRLDREGDPGWVWIDGRLVGLTPVTVSDARPGKHFFTFVAPGAEAEHRFERLGSLDRLAFSPSVTAEGQIYRALLASLAAGFRQGDPGKTAAALLTWARVDELFAIAVSRHERAKVLRLTTAGRVPVMEIEVATPQALAEAVRQSFERRLEQPPVEAAVATVVAPVDTANGSVKRSKVPGVVLLSLAGAAVITGTALLIVGRNTYAKAGSIPQIEQDRYQQALSQSNTLAGAGLGAFGGAVVSAGIGFALVW